jgi:carbamate kinase
MTDVYLKRLVVALGGNAILRSDQRGTVEDQLSNLTKTCLQLVPIIASWYEVVLTHGNGPQVGNILVQNDHSRERVPAMPLDVCGAQSQGQIGYLLQRVLSNELKRLGREAEVCSILSQVVVDPLDPAFENPSKPIGPWLTFQEMEKARREGERWTEDPQKGWRRVVPSPRPVRILNARSIATLLRNGVMVIACGGGGVPVVEEPNGTMRGVEGVIDKDLASARLALEIDAKILLTLTDVPGVFLNFGTPEQKLIRGIRAAEMRGLLDAGAFPAGTIAPKVESALHFVEGGGDRAIIAGLEDAEAALRGKTGTVILGDRDSQGA